MQPVKGVTEREITVQIIKTITITSSKKVVVTLPKSIDLKAYMDGFLKEYDKDLLWTPGLTKVLYEYIVTKEIPYVPDRTDYDAREDAGTNTPGRHSADRSSHSQQPFEPNGPLSPAGPHHGRQGCSEG